MTVDEKSPPPQTPFKVLVLGGSYAGLTAALDMVKLSEGKSPTDYLEHPSTFHVPVDVTIVGERDGFCAPLALIEEDYTARAWTKFSDLKAARHPKLHFLHGSVKAIDCETSTAYIQPHGAVGQEKHSYDYLICATGYRRTWPTVPQALDRESYLAEARGHIDSVKAAEHGIVVIGGGAVGIEMAAEAKMVYPGIKITLVHSRDRLLSAEPLPDEFAEEALRLLCRGGVEVTLGKRVVEVSDDTQPGSANKILRLSDGTSMYASHVISAVSKPTPTSSFLPTATMDAEGLVEVSSSLHFAGVDVPSGTHLAVGDIAAWPPTGTPTIKRCGGAMYMGHVAALNTYQHMLHRLDLAGPPEYTKLPVFPPAIAIALGDTAVGYWEEAGVTKGDELRERMFYDDLGLEICWKGMGLADAPAEEATKA
ncbi:uncharacterized protein LTR77_005918 [Saxophila tyrrhenica]|uniref:FAD/NAD(P)-binding domain-containing protein n=1 Tax=Saxophila tyrrhenica TaxID=1690608 RepID=A0AAV9P9Y1_9PEZI|nr:hypothetical protein LTR77_005918 [Saxophila tyrrhenica]